MTADLTPAAICELALRELTSERQRRTHHATVIRDRCRIRTVQGVEGGQVAGSRGTLDNRRQTAVSNYSLFDLASGNITLSSRRY